MEETSEVKGSPLALGLAGVLYESDDDFVECKLSLSDILCGFLTADPVTEDVQQKRCVNDPERVDESSISSTIK